MYDLVIFNASYNDITWVGIVTIVFAFSVDIAMTLERNKSVDKV